jgi:hypothetical protein
VDADEARVSSSSVWIEHSFFGGGAGGGSVWISDDTRGAGSRGRSVSMATDDVNSEASCWV